MGNAKFATAINCMDGRVQMPVIEWIRRNHNVDFVDMITEPGPNKILAEGREAQLIASIKRRVEISVNKHASGLIAIVGHHDCAGNPTDEDTQRKQIRSAIETVEAWNLGVRVTGLWVDQSWEVRQVK